MSGGEECRQRLEDKERRELAQYALKSADRREQLGERFRESREDPQGSPLEYRTEYHRDRDRIIWSSAFRRLQHKTQIFPHYVEDRYRRRLTHSLEVAQIAGTLCRALKLNEVAAEAMGLGHDVGHAPFGHAGEKSLNQKLQKRLRSSETAAEEITTEADPLYSTEVLLYGFDHCVQG
jgi:dGTPase